MRREHRKVQEVRVKVQHVEVACARHDVVQHREMRGDVGFAGRIVEAKRALAARMQRGARARVPACEERYLMTKIDQCIGQVRDDALGTAVQARGNRLVEGCDLRDAQTLSRQYLARNLLRRAGFDTLHNTAS
jgi:hypothetical protein